MSKIGQYIQGRQENAIHYWGAMDAARGKTLADFSPEEINRMIWSARLWLRGIAFQSHKYVEQVLLTEDARAEITRQAMEAEQTADYREGVGA